MCNNCVKNCISIWRASTSLTRTFETMYKQTGYFVSWHLYNCLVPTSLGWRGTSVYKQIFDLFLNRNFQMRRLPELATWTIFLKILFSKIFYCPKGHLVSKGFFSSMTTECKCLRCVSTSLTSPYINQSQRIWNILVSSTFQTTTTKETDFPWIIQPILSDFLVDGDDKNANFWAFFQRYTIWPFLVSPCCMPLACSVRFQSWNYGPNKFSFQCCPKLKKNLPQKEKQLNFWKKKKNPKFI